ncbi:hypothetical protein HHI36_008371 [Cryptolaemus montrouzieri]|uniref:THAP-type domain-containing protein n=1 Tax=Cryptolaemus montrouzieri TaxID=559131 RepID=A0ABD2MS97_9CUCU
MSRVCCIESCNNKEGPAEKHNFFQFPKDEARKRKWEQVTDGVLKGSQQSVQKVYICSEHFLPTDFETKPLKLFIDGREEILPRKRKRLKPHAVPFISGTNKQGEENEKLINSVDFITYNDNMSMNATECDTAVCVTETKVAVMNVIEINRKLFQKELLSIKTEDLPLHWIPCTLPRGILFIFTGDTFCYPTRSLLINWDMSFEIRGHNRLADFPQGPSEIHCLEDVKNLLCSISELHLCEGDGYGVFCKNVFFSSEQKPKTKRCPSCRSNHKRKYDATFRSESRVASSKERDKKNIKNLKRQLERRDDAIAIANENIEQLREQCAKVPEYVLEETIAAMPKTQQESLKSCIRAAQKLLGNVQIKQMMMYAKRKEK